MTLPYSHPEGYGQIVIEKGAEKFNSPPLDFSFLFIPRPMDSLLPQQSLNNHFNGLFLIQSPGHQSLQLF